MPAAIHRTRHGQCIGLGFGDGHTLAGEQGHGHAQLFVGDDFDGRAITLDAQVFAQQGAAAGGFIDFNGHGVVLLGVVTGWTTGGGRLLHQEAERHFALCS
ncbi:hypothetical protein D3C76_1653830 [compost metagenome]